MMISSYLYIYEKSRENIKYHIRKWGDIKGIGEKKMKLPAGNTCR
ncbi:hypothetical protein [Mediterraneibacter massiliensis]|nr:hypothetical protein [Mediterraneibacter massiliensis]